MAPLKPTAVLLHGAWHTPATFAPLSKVLRDHGYPVHDTLQLPCTGTSFPLSNDVDAIREVLHQLIEVQGRDVVLVMHSLSGIAGGLAARDLGKQAREHEGKSGGILKLVGLSANVPKIGESHLEQVFGFCQSNGIEPSSFFEARDDGTLEYTGDEQIFYNDLPEDAQKRLMDALVPKQSAASFHTPITYSAWADIPSVHIIQEKDICMPPMFQRHIAGLIPKVEKMESIDTGHAGVYSQPEQVADIIMKVIVV